MPPCIGGIGVDPPRSPRICTRLLLKHNNAWATFFEGLLQDPQIFYTYIRPIESIMATSKPEILISQLSDEIETKLKWLKLCFRGPKFEFHG